MISKRTGAHGAPGGAVARERGIGGELPAAPSHSSVDLLVLVSQAVGRAATDSYDTPAATFVPVRMAVTGRARDRDRVEWWEAPARPDRSVGGSGAGCCDGAAIDVLTLSPAVWVYLATAATDLRRFRRGRARPPRLEICRPSATASARRDFAREGIDLARTNSMWVNRGCRDGL